MTPKWLSDGVTGFATWIGGILGKNEKLVDASKNMNRGIAKAGEVVDGGFDVLVWVKANWQLVILGSIAILVIVRK